MAGHSAAGLASLWRTSRAFSECGSICRLLLPRNYSPPVVLLLRGLLFRKGRADAVGGLSFYFSFAFC